MPMFASLGGNDIIDYDQLQSFQTSLGTYHSKFYKIAEYVRSKYISKSNLDDRTLDEIARRCGITDQQLLTSLDSYDINYTAPVDPMTVISGGLSFARHILSSIPQTNSLDLCDMQMPGLLNLRQLWIPLFERQIGVVMFHLKTPFRKFIRTRLVHTDEMFFDLEIIPKRPNCK